MANKVFRTLSDVREEVTGEALSQQPLLTDDYTYDTVNDRRKDIEDNFNNENEILDEMSDTDAYVAPAEDLPVIVEPENDLLTGKPKQGTNQLEDNEVPIDRTSGNNQNKNDQESDAAYNDLQDEFLVDEIIIVEEVPDDLLDELSADDLQDDASGNSGDINKGKAAQEDTTKKDNSNPCGCKKQG